MGNQSLAKNPTTRLLVSCSAIVGSTIYGACTGDAFTASTLIISSVLDVIKALAPEVLGDAFQDKFINNESSHDILRNGDLERAVGKAISELIKDESKNASNETTREIIRDTGKKAAGLWIQYVEKTFEKQNEEEVSIYSELEKIQPNQLTQYFALRDTDMEGIETLNEEAWIIIVRDLFVLNKYPQSKAIYEIIAARLHKDFAGALRKVLVDDFAGDGKAYASMQLRIVGEILSYIKEIHQTNKQILTIVIAISEKINEIDTKIDRFTAQLSVLTEPDNKSFLNYHLYPSIEDKNDFPVYSDFLQKQADLLNLFVINRLGQTIVAEKSLEQQTEQTGLQKRMVGLMERLIESSNLPIKLPEIPKKLPISRFPSRVNFFTGRKIILENIEKSLKDYQTASLFGTHGLGKSSIATEFAYLNEDIYSHVFFIRAFGAEFDLYIGEIVENLHFETDEQTTPDQKLAMFQHWLAENEKWLLILDNVNEASAINDCNFTSLGGFVLFTSNDSQIHQIGNKVEVPNMETEEAASLLYQHWKGEKIKEFEDIPEEKRELAKEIAIKFGNSPLAMTFVGVYLAEEGESLTEFLETYQNKKKNLLANYKFLSNYQHEEVAAPFLLAFEAITKAKEDTERETLLAEAVKDYLKICAYLSPNDMPEEFFQKCVEKLHPGKTEFLADRDFFKEVRKRLTKSSIFERDSDKQTFTTHRLVQEIMRFEIKDEENRLLEVIAETLDESVSYFDYTNREKVELYLAHLQSYIEYLEKFEIEPNDFTANLSDKIARYYNLFGQYEIAKKYNLICRDICERIYGDNHIKTASSYNNLGVAYNSQGDYPKAEENHLKSLQVKLNILGENHPDTAMSYNNLGNVYNSQGDYPKAEENHLKSLQVKLNILGENHPDTATSYNNLGLVYENQGDYSKAEENHLKSLQIKLNIFGENYPDTAISYNNLGLVYYSQGAYSKAKENHLKSLQIYLNIFGENYPDTAMSYNNLGLVYDSQGDYLKAEENYLKSLEIKLNIFGENHPLTATSFGNLGVFYENQNKFDEAERYSQKTLEIFEKFLPENHPYIQRAKDNLERVRKILGKA